MSKRHRYWRLVGINVVGSFLEVSNIELFEPGFVSTNSGATVTSSDVPTEPLSNLTDGNTSTRCYWTSTVAEHPDFFIQWDFGAGNEKSYSVVSQSPMSENLPL